jgi:hypothetical protein
VSVPKLKGLLDSANAKLAGLLGDFPQGFNAGAVAGFPGWAGDMAYLADTARLALTGADSQAAPEDYVGTTDYIAKQAGYPVPQTLSGQLGAAVGGLMSPGPGDLAKFAPVLSAIPFWHGSPHKFDRFDLAHMGKGEGAQAYGWGGYGAESPEVASQYAGALADAKRDTINSAIERVIHINNGDVGSIRDALILNGFNRDDISPDLVSAMADVIKNTDTDGTVNSAAIKAYDRLKAIVPAEANLYKGEYRWPDPAKEAATPLTGEDLLQWYRPLSEQPEGVRKALAAIDARKFGYEQNVDPVVRDYVWSNGSKKIGSSTLDEGGGLIPPSATGKDIYTTLEMLTTGSRDASQKLAELGIPGIRYLDGMSRGYTVKLETAKGPYAQNKFPTLDAAQQYAAEKTAEGFKTDIALEGTHNYVMFSDEGIKLLERNGKPIEDFAARRAGKAKPYREAMGADTIPPMNTAEPPVPEGMTRIYHGMTGKRRKPGQWWSASREVAEGFAADSFRTGEVYYMDIPATEAERLAGQADATGASIPDELALYFRKSEAKGLNPNRVNWKDPNALDAGNDPLDF